MSECNSIETTNIYSNLSDQTKIRLNEINKIKDYLNSKIQERKIMSKKLSKYIAAFDYFEKTLFSISATNGGWTIISFVNVIRAPVGLASANFSLVFSLTTGIIKKLLSKTRNKKEKHQKIFMLDKSKLISHTLIDLEVSHEEFKTIVEEKEKYEIMEERIRMMKSSDELIESNQNIKKDNGNAQN